MFKILLNILLIAYSYLYWTEQYIGVSLISFFLNLSSISNIYWNQSAKSIETRETWIDATYLEVGVVDMETDWPLDRVAVAAWTAGLQGNSCLDWTGMAAKQSITING